ncbi:MAG: hypothetical protein FJ225_06555 [Lentisphaerae bacterium]|nr:hypothetical protein [Lentisphaerota bacterium]
MSETGNASRVRGQSCRGHNGRARRPAFARRLRRAKPAAPRRGRLARHGGKGHVRVFHIATWALILASACAAAAEEGAWRTYRGDTALRGATDLELPDRPALLWRYRAGAPIMETPVCDGTLLFVTTRDARVIALDLNGAEKWTAAPRPPPATNRTSAAESFEAPPACAAGLVLVCGAGGTVYALDAATGSERWRYDAGANIRSTANWEDDGNGKPGRVVILTQPDGALHCLATDTGRAVWNAPGAARTDGSIAVHRGRIVFGSCDSALHVVSLADGRETLAARLGDGHEIAAGVAVEGDRAFTGNRSGSLVCVDLASGKTLWVCEEGGGELFTTPAVRGDRVVFASGDGDVLCVAKDSGRAVWRLDANAAEAKSPVIAGAHVAAALDGTLHLLSLENGRELWSFEAGDRITAPAVVGGMILIGTDQGHVLAFGRRE